MKATEIREAYFKFFEERGHERVPSAPVVPQDDPTLYFTNAGMNQFKDVFLGLGTRPYTRAVDTQKCIRVSGKHNDLEEVGVSPRHHTFFEMLGNWSFGDYFKQEAISWAWELVTERWGLDKERLWATVFEGSEADGLEPDDEAARLWRQCTDLPPERIVPLPAKENFWEMGETGPCGPCSEVHYYHGDLAAQSADGLRRGDDEYEEFWNLVFIQYNRDQDGVLHPLPAQHVDTGMGFERICSIMQQTPTNYETDVFQPIIARISEIAGLEYAGDHLVPMRVIADHARALSSAIADGALPANDGRGYVLRRILRRAARYGRQLGQHDPFIYSLVEVVAESLGSVFPELVQQRDHISLVIRSEEEGFGRALDRGLEIFERLSQKGEVTGSEAFQLYDTYGFPLDLTQLLARERDIPLVDPEAFDSELEAQRKRARQATRGQFAATEGVGDALEGEHSVFVGYDSTSCTAQVVHAEADAEGMVHLFLDRTPFYAEAGGQVGDRGIISGSGFTVRVVDAVKSRGGIMHRGQITSGAVASISGEVTASVDEGLRGSAARNHTATHLLHEALRQTLGDHVAQMGSLVAPDRLRFDFSHFAAISPEQLVEIESMVNDRIRADLRVETMEAGLAEARAMGARALFGEKYADRVRMVQLVDFSLELCGGTHVGSTGEIGLFSLLYEGSVAAGTRRVEAVTGIAAEQQARSQRELLVSLGAMLNAQPDELSDKLAALQKRARDLERAGAEMERRLAAQAGEQMTDGACEVEGVKVVATRVEVQDVPGLRTAADALREQLGSGVGALGAHIGDKVSFIVVVTDDLIRDRGLRAGDLVKEVAQIAGGSGGGKPHLAQAGGRDPEKLDAALAAVPEIVGARLKR
jgi:alanyl-tRNA synthetase